MGAFTHDHVHFVLENIAGLQLANRVPVHVNNFLDQIAASCEYTANLSRRQLISWFVARLNYLASGQIERSDDSRNNDGGCFLISLVAVEANRPSGIFRFEIYPNRIVISGSRDTQACDPIPLFIQAVAREPDCIETCRVEARDAESGKTWSCGWEAGEFIVF